jgi:hypothetical protein
MARRFIRTTGMFLILIGFFFVMNSISNFTGFAVFEDFGGRNVARILGIVFVIVGILAAMAGREERKEGGLEGIAKEDEYYRRRTKEIFDAKYKDQDVYVSRWELDGIMDYIKNATNNRGDKIYPESSFEHGTDTPSIHPYGSHKKVHINVHVEDRNGGYIRRHLLITDDPYDLRLKTIGLDLSKGNRVKSKVYYPKHPRYDKNVYKRQTNITYERDL